MPSSWDCVTPEAGRHQDADLSGQARNTDTQSIVLTLLRDTKAVRTPSKRSRRKELLVDPLDLRAIASAVRYVGSAEHKTYPSQAGPPRPRADATKCDPNLHGDFEVLSALLVAGICAGHIGGPVESSFPRYVWAEMEGEWYEARLVNREQGTYKGYGIDRSELPLALRSTP